MKKLITVFSLVSMLAFSAALGGCSSAQKEPVEAAPVAEAPAAVQPAPASPDLGASSAGRGI
jgi:hypothetical protein